VWERERERERERDRERERERERETGSPATCLAEKVLLLKPPVSFCYGAQASEITRGERTTGIPVVDSPRARVAAVDALSKDAIPQIAHHHFLFVRRERSVYHHLFESVPRVCVIVLRETASFRLHPFLECLEVAVSLTGLVRSVLRLSLVPRLLLSPSPLRAWHPPCCLLLTGWGLVFLRGTGISVTREKLHLGRRHLITFKSLVLAQLLLNEGLVIVIRHEKVLIILQKMLVKLSSSPTRLARSSSGVSICTRVLSTQVNVILVYY